MNILVVGDVTHDRFLALNPSDVGLHCNLNSQDCEICFQYAQKIPVEAVIEDFGGNAGNVAVSAARQGEAVTLISQLGDDEIGRQALAAFTQAGITVDRVAVLPGERTNFSVIITYRGERTIFSYHNPHPYNVQTGGEFDLIYLTSLGGGYEKVYEQVLQDHQNTKIIFQPGTIQIKGGLSRLKPVLARSDTLILNREEARQLTGTTDEPTTLLNSLLDTGAREVVITDGQNGVYLSDGQASFWVGVWPGAIRKETTGVGDAFAAAYLVARAEGSMTEAAQLGSINAGSVMQYVGAQKGLLTKPELRRRYREAKAVIKVTAL